MVAPITKHHFVSAKSDGVDPTVIQPSHWNTSHDITLSQQCVIGAYASGNAVEITISANLQITSGNVLDISAALASSIASVISNASTALANAAAAQTTANAAQTTANAALPKAGGTMSGNVAMAGSIFTGLGTPANAGDSVNKAYADGILGAFAWVTFAGASSGTSMTIGASKNVASVTRNAAGDYTVTFTSAAPDANYVAICNAMDASASNTREININGFSKSTAAYRFVSTIFNDATSSNCDWANYSLVFFR